MIQYVVEHFFAGVWSAVFHWGMGTAAIILLVAGAYFAGAIPVVGPWLHELRKDMLWAALAVATFMWGMGVGNKDEKKICTAQTVVVTKYVDKAVAKAKNAHSRAEKDPYDSPDN